MSYPDQMDKPLNLPGIIIAMVWRGLQRCPGDEPGRGLLFWI